MEGIVYLNGELVAASEARVSVFDHGFLYGYGLFETMRAYRGRIFLLERHLKRLMQSADTIGMGPGLADVDLAQACQDTLEANNLQDARIRLTVTNGESDTFPWAGASGRATVVITAIPYAPPESVRYVQGVKIGLTSLRRCQQSLLSSIKSTDYLLSVLARMEAARQGLHETLMLNDDGFIAEGSGSNVFFVKASRLVTPSLGSGILPGITRQVVIELADRLGITVTEGTVGLGSLKHSDEAFLTNSMIGIMPLVQVRDDAGDTITIGSGKPGRMTKKFMADYKAMVEKETAA
jgi:branched-chain amino acid aminotransferase group I